MEEPLTASLFRFFHQEAHHATLLSLSLLAIILIALIPDARAQGAQLFPWELEVDVEIETKLTIYDGEGNSLHNATISDTDNWRGDLDTPSNCPVPAVCDWSFEWEAEADTEILFFEFKRSSTNEGLGIYAYVPATERDGRGTFYLPWDGQLVNNWDMYFEVVYESGAYVTKAGRGAGALYEDEFSGLYTIPYDLPYYCAQTTCNANDDRSFLAKVEYVPEPTFPGEPYREFTLASEADAKVISNWSPTWDVQDLVLKFPQGRSLVVEGDLDASGTTLTEADPGQGWGGIDVLGAGTDLDLTNGAVVEHAATGVAVYEGATADLAGFTLRNNGTGLVVLASHYENLAAESGDGARSGGAHVAVTERLRGAASVTEAGTPSLMVYPNPVSASDGAATATAALTFEKAAEVRVIVYDVLGRAVTTLHEGELAAGSHEFVLDSAVLSAEVYLIRVEAGERRFTERLTVVR